MPASPETFVRPAKNGVTFVEFLENWYRNRTARRGENRRLQFADAPMDVSRLRSSKPKSVTESVTVRCSENVPSIVLRGLSDFVRATCTWSRVVEARSGTW